MKAVFVFADGEVGIVELDDVARACEAVIAVRDDVEVTLVRTRLGRKCKATGRLERGTVFASVPPPTMTPELSIAITSAIEDAGAWEPIEQLPPVEQAELRGSDPGVKGPPS